MLYIQQRVRVHSYGHTDIRQTEERTDMDRDSGGFCYEADSHKN